VWRERGKQFVSVIGIVARVISMGGEETVGINGNRSGDGRKNGQENQRG
jgi:hypothetical protein